VSRYLDRMIRAASLDRTVFAEIGEEGTAFGRAMGVAALASLAAGLNRITWHFDIAVATGLFRDVSTAAAAWFIGAFSVYLLGACFFFKRDAETKPGKVLRVLGFAAAPGILMVFGMVPGLAGIVRLIASTWLLLAMIVAAREALDFRSAAGAALACCTGWILASVLFWLVRRLI